MNLAYLKLLLDYHYWARDRMLAAVAALSHQQYARNLGNSFPSVRATANHVYLAEWIWFSRWKGESPAGFPSQDELPDLSTLRTTWAAHEAELRAFLHAMTDADVASVFACTLLNGTAGTSPFWEMFVHLINHSTYHRGQVTTMLRQLGAKPPESTDMIAFFRTGSA
jgi:uncharacterized damage-inducible protein DinB